MFAKAFFAMHLVSQIQTADREGRKWKWLICPFKAKGANLCYRWRRRYMYPNLAYTFLRKHLSELVRLHKFSHLYSFFYSFYVPYLTRRQKKVGCFPPWLPIVRHISQQKHLLLQINWVRFSLEERRTCSKSFPKQTRRERYRTTTRLHLLSPKTKSATSPDHGMIHCV